MLNPNLKGLNLAESSLFVFKFRNSNLDSYIILLISPISVIISTWFNTSLLKNPILNQVKGLLLFILRTSLILSLYDLVLITLKAYLKLLEFSCCIITFTTLIGWDPTVLMRLAVTDMKNTLGSKISI